ncbi:MAG: PDZ domain-containing protein [Steroidobacteraceae bacterium]
MRCDPASNMARSIVDRSLRYGSVRRGSLGVNIAPVTPDVAQALGLPNANGALVTQVVDASAAAKAGIRAGDVIAVNGRAVKSHTDPAQRDRLLRVGERVDIALLRDGQAQAHGADRGACGRHAAAATASGEPAKPPHGRASRATLADAPAGGVQVRAIAAEQPRGGDGAGRTTSSRALTAWSRTSIRCARSPRPAARWVLGEATIVILRCADRSPTCRS